MTDERDSVDLDARADGAALQAGLGSHGISDLDHGTIIVLPSISFSSAELRKIVGIQHYEERLLFMTLLLLRPSLRMVFVSSVPIQEAVIDYYLGFLPDPADARRRLSVVSLDDNEPRALSAKLLDRPEALEQIAALIEPDDAYILPFNVTLAELEVSNILGAPLYGPHPDLVALGSKSGSRIVARSAGVPVLEGQENISSVADIEAALTYLREHRPDAKAAVIKLNNGFSGQGNAIVDLDTMVFPITSSPTVFCAEEEAWETFATKIEDEAGVVEELVREPGAVSPSVQMRIAPDGTYEIVSTHDQILGGPDGQVYLGCRFPARQEYRLTIQDHAANVAKILAGRGVIGSFGIDFIVVPKGDEYDVYLSEINLRLGGTTHPFLMTRLVTGGRYDDSTGDLIANGTRKFYVATDNFKSDGYKGITPQDLIAALDERGLIYDPKSATGVTLHLLGALKDYGKVGAVCIADSFEDADVLYEQVTGTLEYLAAL
jgi:PGM1 C-terminal domain/ATP-grasp domain